MQVEGLQLLKNYLLLIHGSIILDQIGIHFWGSLIGGSTYMRVYTLNAIEAIDAAPLVKNQG